MSNRLFQSLVFQMKEIISRTVGVMDENHMIVASSDLAQVGGTRTAPDGAPGDVVQADGYTFHFVGPPGQKAEYAVFVQGADDQAARYAAMTAIALQGFKQHLDEKYDRVAFIKNVVLDNILPGDVYAKARELHFPSENYRVVVLIRAVSGPEVTVLDILSELFPDKQKDFIFTISEAETVLVKEIRQGVDSRALNKLAGSIVDTLEGEHHVKAVVGIGTPVVGIKDLAASFKEAQVALEVGKVFDTERAVIPYDDLGIARLIYQLPTTLCEMFLKEVFKKGSVESLDKETLFTIQRFFENNLNVSETSRGLFVHRNTLVYRLEKIKKLTGLDLREFDHAIVFKVALMVRKYLDSKPTKY